MILRLYSTLLLIGIASILFSQRSSNPKVVKGLSKVHKYTKLGKYAKTEKTLRKLSAKYPEDLAVSNRLAVYYLDSKQYDTAVPILLEIAKQNPADYRTWYTLYRTSMQLEQYDQADQYLSKAMSRVDPSTKQYSQIESDLMHLKFVSNAKSNPVPFNPVRWDDKVNSKHLEYLPSVAIDGTVIFTRRINGVEDIYICHRDLEGVFSTPQLMDIGPVNGNIGAHFINPEGNLLFVSIDDQQNGYGSYDLYYSIKNNDQWSKLKNLGQTVNSNRRDIQPCLSADGKELYFVSDRSGGIGGTDIYVTRLVDHKWSTPELLSEVFNTSLNEESPFIHPDGKTFYYRSDGRVGMGDFDIYVTRKDAGQWQPPSNIGYPINTETSEGALFVDIHGQKAYYASDAGLDNLDIFEFDLPYEHRPDPITYALINVYDAMTGKPISAQISIVDLMNGTSTEVETSPTTGEYSQIFDTGNSYAITISMNGYAFYSANINLTEQASADVPYVYNIGLQPINQTTDTLSEVEPTPIRLNNIFFNSGEYVLLPQSATEIQNLTNLLNQSPSIEIRIHGHTDAIGNEEDNLLLSERRAEAVYTAVINSGISRSRVSYRGYGESVPVATNDTETGRQLNRRTEFVIISQ